MWHLMPDGRYAVTVTVDGRKDTTKLVSVAREGPDPDSYFFGKCTSDSIQPRSYQATSSDLARFCSKIRILKSHISES